MEVCHVGDPCGFWFGQWECFELMEWGFEICDWIVNQRKL